MEMEGEASSIAQLHEQLAALTRINHTLQAEIRERQENEAALQKQVRQMRMLVERVPVAIAMFDLETGCVLAGDRWLETFSSEHSQGRSMTDIFPEVGECWVELHQRCLNRGEEVRDKWNVCSPDGTMEWYERIVCPWYDETGKIGGTIATAEVITPDKQIEEQLRESQQLFQLVMDNIPQLIMWKDRHSVYKGCNLSMARVAGLESPEEIIGKTDYDLPWKTEEAQWYRSCDRQVMDSGQPNLHIIETQQQADGRQAWLDTNKIPLRDAQGNVIGILVTIEDITERQQAQETLREINKELEKRVKARTEKLRKVVTDLKRESRDRHQIEEQLRHSEARLQRLADNIPGVIHEFRIESNGHRFFSFLSSGARDLFELEPEVLMEDATPAFDRVHPEDLPGFQADIERSVRQLETLESEFRYMAPSGQKWFRMRFRPERLPGGATICYVCTFDITDRHQIEEQLRASEARLQRLADNIPGTIYEFRMAPNGDRSFSFLSSGARDVFELEPDLLLQDAQLAFDRVHREDLPRFQVELNRSAKTLKNVESELRLLVPSGLKWIQVLARPERQPGGEIIWYACITDITERKLVQVELTKLSLVASQTDSAVIIADKNGLTEWVNDSFVRITGYTFEEVRGKKPGSLLQGPLSDLATVDRIREAIRTRTPFQGEILNYNKQGRLYWLWLSINPIFDSNGELSQFIAIESDISERKQYELQLKQQTEELEQTLSELKRTQVQLVQSEKMSSLGQLVAGIAHEINNPVNFIYGNLSYVNEYAEDLLAVLDIYQTHYPEPPPEVREKLDLNEIEFLQADLTKLLQSMRVGTDRIREIVLSLRTFSRLDEAEVKEIDIHDGIESTLTILQNRLKANSVRIAGTEYQRRAIEVVKDYGKLPRVECYSGPLNQVFMNILTNAIDAIDERDRTRTPEDIDRHPSTIRISSKVDDAAEWVMIRIVDNGPGIPEEIQRQIFDPFFTTKEIGKGTGLGMSISYQIVTEKHQGSLKCISQLGVGTEFIVEIPIRTPSVKGK